MIKKRNKKGAIGIILFFAALLLILIIGFMAVNIAGIVGYVSGEITPIMEDIGMVGETNLSSTAEQTFGVVDSIIQSVPMLVGFGYVMALIFTLVFVLVAGYNPHPAFIGFYVALMFLLVFGAIVMSNIYQDIYTGTDEIALMLQEQSLMSYLILYSPFLLSIIAIIGGIIMFGVNNSSSRSGGYGV